jgi:hypothetical protein
MEYTPQRRLQQESFRSKTAGYTHNHAEFFLSVLKKHILQKFLTHNFSAKFAQKRRN